MRKTCRAQTYINMSYQRYGLSWSQAGRLNDKKQRGPRTPPGISRRSILNIFSKWHLKNFLQMNEKLCLQDLLGNLSFCILGHVWWDDIRTQFRRTRKLPPSFYLKHKESWAKRYLVQLVDQHFFLVCAFRFSRLKYMLSFHVNFDYRRWKLRCSTKSAPGRRLQGYATGLRGRSDELSSF